MVWCHCIYNCHSKQLHTTVFQQHVCLTTTIYSYVLILSNIPFFTSHCIKKDLDTLIEQSRNYSNRAIKARVQSQRLPYIQLAIVLIQFKAFDSLQLC